MIYRGVVFIFIGSSRNRATSKSFIPCPIPKIANGVVRLRSRGRSARITCAVNFILEGSRNIACQSGRWEDAMPYCISNTHIFQ